MTHREVEQVEQIEIVRVRHGRVTREPDQVVREAPVTILLNGEEFVTLLCTPEKLSYLAVGFLRSEGLLEKASDILSIRVEEEKGYVYVDTVKRSNLAEKLYGKRTITSGCGKGTIFFNVLDSLRSRPVKSEVRFTANQVLQLMDQLKERSVLFKNTGGIHSAALCSAERILFFSEDIGRHNALDKIIGKCILEEVEVEDKLCLSTGRLSSEVILKAVKAQIPVLISRSAPTSLGVQLARELGVTLIGFARGRRLNIYSHNWRVKG